MRKDGKRKIDWPDVKIQQGGERGGNNDGHDRRRIFQSEAGVTS